MWQEHRCYGHSPATFFCRLTATFASPRSGLILGFLRAPWWTRAFLNLFFNCIHDRKLAWDNLCEVTTDGSPAMTDKWNGIASMVYRKVHDSEGDAVKMHCIIHQEAVGAKAVQLSVVMNVVEKPSTQSQTTPAFLVWSQYWIQTRGLTLILYVQWLSSGSVLQQFYSLKCEIDQFFKEDRAPVSNLPSFVDLAFLVDANTDEPIKTYWTRACKAKVNLCLNCTHTWKHSMWNTYTNACKWFASPHFWNLRPLFQMPTFLQKGKICFCDDHISNKKIQSVLWRLCWVLHTYSLRVVNIGHISLSGSFLLFLLLLPRLLFCTIFWTFLLWISVILFGHRNQ